MQSVNSFKMSHQNKIKLYEWLSYLFIAGATVFLFMQNRLQGSLVMAALLLAIGMFMRMLIERTRYKACEEENEELKSDLRRLTALLAEEKKKKIN